MSEQEDLTPEEQELLESITLFSRPDEIKRADEAQKTTLMIQDHIDRFAQELRRLELPKNEIEYRIREEKVRVAKERLEKSKLAQREVTIYWGGQKVADAAQEVESSTDIIIDTTLDAWTVCRHVASKNCVDLELPWSLVVFDSDSSVMRTVEDHENVYSIVESWKCRGLTSRKLFFRTEEKKYHLFDSPAAYFNELADNVNPTWKRSQRRFVIRRNFLTKYFRDETCGIPTMDIELHIRVGTKKWKKVHAFLTEEGLFYEKLKDKDNKVPYVLFKKCKIFETTNFDILFKSPSAAVIALEEESTTEDYIKAICFDNRFAYITWYSAMRMGSFSQQLLVNWDTHIERTKLLVKLKGHGLSSKAKRRTPSFLDISPPTIEINLQRGSDYHLDWSHRTAEWYHGKLDRMDQQCTLEQLGGRDGLFLVRESTTSEGQCVLVLCSKGNILNFLINEEGGGYSVGESKPFTTIQLLIDELKTEQSGLPCCLTHHAPKLLSRVLLRNVAELEKNTLIDDENSDKEDE